MKYIASFAIAMLVSNEIFTLAVLSVMAVMIIGDILKERVS